MTHMNRAFKCGSHLFYEKDRSRELYIIQDGAVEVYRKIGGHEVVLARLAKGAVLGEMALIDGKPRSASARAVTDCTVLMIESEKLIDKIAGVPGWYLSLVKSTSEKIRKAITRLESAVSEYPVAKITLTLNYLIMAAPRPAGGQAKSLDLYTTQTRLVQLMGMTHRRIVEAFEHLQGHGLIVTSGNTLTVANPGRVNDFCLFLRHVLKKSYDKMPTVTREVKTLINLAIEKRLAILDPSAAQTEISSDDMVLMMKTAGYADTMKSGVDNLKEWGLLHYRKTEDSGDKNTLSGYKFTIENAPWLKWYLYCQFSPMMPSK